MPDEIYTLVDLIFGQTVADLHLNQIYQNVLDDLI